MRKVSLYFREGSSDKEYHVQLEPKGSGFVVNFQYGRRGSTLTSGTKTDKPVAQDKAEQIFQKLVAEKKAKGYTEGEEGTPYVGTDKEERNTGRVPQLLNPIDEDEVDKYLRDPEWGAQLKKDGKHVMIAVEHDKVIASNRKGLEIGISDPIVKSALELGHGHVLDGEAIGDVFWAFDMLSRHDGMKVVKIDTLGYGVRHGILMDRLGTNSNRQHTAIKGLPLYCGEKAKRDLYTFAKAQALEGIVFKKLDAPYTPGKPNSGGSMLKFKFYATCSCRVSKGREGKRSVALELHSGEDCTIAVGNVTVPANQSIPKVGDIVEVRYLYAFKDGSLFQPVLLGVRDDLDWLKDCRISQLKYKAEEEE
jgi:bifunctional non-homologous end joining protein LigD